MPGVSRDPVRYRMVKFGILRRDIDDKGLPEPGVFDGDQKNAGPVPPRFAYVTAM